MSHPIFRSMVLRSRVGMVILLTGSFLTGHLLLSQAARATLPGYNGQIMFHTNRHGSACELYLTDPDGSHPENLTTPLSPTSLSRIGVRTGRSWYSLAT